MLKELQKGICQVVFNKVKDNSVRTILCTLVKGTIPAKFEDAIDAIYMPQEIPDIVPIWDIEEGAWKSFRLTKVIEFRDSTEIQKTQRTAHQVVSSLQKTLQERRKEAKERHEKKVQELKEEAQKAKERMENK